MTKRVPIRRPNRARLTAVPRRSGPFAPVEEAIAAMREVRLAIVVDDEDRENEGDLCMAAEKASPEAINFMAKYGRGLICLTLTGERCDKLRLGPISQQNTSAFGTAFCESIDARVGTTTGISAADRARTIVARLKGLRWLRSVCEGPS